MTRRRRRGLGGAACVIAVAAGLAPAPANVSHLDTPHPGRLVAIDLGERGASALREGRVPEAEQLLQQAVAADPLDAAAWIALAAVRIEGCDRDGARFAALAAARTAGSAAESAVADEAARRAAAANCGPPPARDRGAVARAEAAVGARPSDYRAWAEAAAARRAQGDLLLAAFEEEQALGLGGEPAIRRMKLARDLEQAGLWRSALELLAAGQGDEARADELAGRIAEKEPAARRIAAALAAGKGWSDAEALQGLEDLALAALAAEPDESPERVAGRLAELLGVPPAAAIEGPWGRALLRPGWSVVEPPAGLAGVAPAVLLRRFPGDTQLALYDPGRSWSSDAAANERFIRERLLAGREAQQEGAPQDCSPAPAAARCERSRWTVSTGAEGRAPVGVTRLASAGVAGSREIWAIGLAGDAGCGSACGEAALRALADQLAAIDPAATPPGASLDGACGWPVPSAFLADRVHREREEPWRRIGIGEGLVIEVPPGVVAARVDRTFRDESAGRETVLWLRGSFEDQSGTTVTIGGPGWAGWVDSRPLGDAPTRPDPSTVPPPRTDPGARRLAGADLTPARRAAGIAGEAVTARFAGDAFRGTWLVHRVRAGTRELEIALPIAAGEKGLAPLWIAITARPSASEPPPPPYDLARRFRVRLDRQAVSRSPADPREGMLVGEGIRFLVPRGFRATLSGASADGFPVTLRNDHGSLIVVLRFESPDELAIRRRDLDREWGAPREPWKALRSTRERTVESAVYPPAEEGGVAPRRAAALVTADGAFLVLMSPGKETDPAAWTAESELVTSSLKGR
jgi:hypothetical protein